MERSSPNVPPRIFGRLPFGIMLRLSKNSAILGVSISGEVLRLSCLG